MSASTAGSGYRDLSLWHETCGDDLTPRPSLASVSHADRDVDVAIIGAGYTGLWTAYYLKRADPSVRVAVIDAEIAGFGASGRNGGWCSALYPVSLTTLAREHGRDAAIRQYRAMQATIDEIERVVHAEAMDVDWALGGTVNLARSEPQLLRARTEVEEAQSFGFDDHALLTAHDARERVHATSVFGAAWTPHCAVIHPSKLARSLASRVEHMGVPIHERTTALEIFPGRVRTNHGDLRARTIVRATEGFTARLPGMRRSLAPVYSLMIATEPLPDEVWDRVGLAARETFADLRHVIIYGQRTADGRMVFGGRGAPYHWRSRIKTGYDQVPRVFEMLRETLIELFPSLSSARITHRWGGPLALARDWHASVGLDRRTGLAWAGGYVGDGVSTTNLAGRTLCDLILDRESDLLTLPWVNHRSPSWEPEPLRWLGANLALNGMRWADRAEARTGSASRLAPLVNRVLSR